jgi:hypothetical protein
MNAIKREGGLDVDIKGTLKNKGLTLDISPAKRLVRALALVAST